MVDAVKKMVGLVGDEDKCEEKIQEKAAGKIYDKIWPILSDRLCNKFEENAENMATRITDYIVHQIEEKPDIIMPIVKKMLEVMNPITNNTEEERKSLVDLLENITNKLNELRNSQEIAKSYSTPKPEEEKEKPFSETVNAAVGATVGATVEQAQGATVEPAQGATVEQAQGATVEPTQGATLPSLPTGASSLSDLTSKLPGPLGSIGASALGSASALTDKLPINPSELSAKIPSLSSLPSLPSLPSSVPLPSVPTSASGLMSMAANASKGLEAAPKTGGSRRMMRTYKNRLINNLYKKGPISGKTPKRRTRKIA